MVEDQNKAKTQKKKSNKKLIIILVVIALFVAGMTGIHMYAKDYYRATATATKAAAGDAFVSVEKTKQYYYFSSKDPQKASKGGLIFYPGGKVEETAYAPLLRDLAIEGYEVYLVRMPMHLAIFGVNKADSIIKKHPEITEWTMMGHSLGGAMAATYAEKHEEEIDNLVLLAAYSTKDLSDSGLQVIQVYGSNDKVLKMDSVTKYEDNLPADAVTYVIEGGNHANYAFYGEQEGDGEATISREEQQQQLLDLMMSSGF